MTIRWAIWLGVFLALSVPLAAQDSEVAAARALAASDPDRALAALESLMARASGYRRRVEVLRAKAQVLADAGRRRDAEPVWRDLARSGEDVTAELLAFSGARLDVESPKELAPGPASLRLSGERTGPLELRLYRVDTARLREAVARTPQRGLWAHLRAPPPAALTKIADWRGASLDGAREEPLPVPLEAGLHLLTITAREVVRPVPLLASSLRAVAARESGPGVLFLAHRQSGRPAASVEVMGHDARGAASGSLGRTDARGLLTFGGDALWASAWVDDTLLISPLPPERSPPAPREVDAELDRARARPGETLHVRASAAPGAKGPWALRLLDPSGIPVVRRELTPGRTGVAREALLLPPRAQPGEWRVEVEGEPMALTLLPPVSPVRLTLTIPPVLAGAAELRAEAHVFLAGSRLPLSGALTWTLESCAGEPAWDRDAPCPQPRYALRPQGPQREVAKGAATTNSEGIARWTIPLPEVAGPTLFRLRVRARGAQVEAQSAAAPSDVLLAIQPARTLAAPREVVPVRLRATHLDGRPAVRRDVSLTIVQGSVREVRTFRMDAAGSARTTLSLGSAGRVSLEAWTRDDARREVRASAGLWLVARGVQLAPAKELEVVLDEARGAALAVFPFAEGSALVTRSARGRVTGEVLEIRGSALQAWITAGSRMDIWALWRGELLAASAERPLLSKRLKVAARAEAPSVSGGEEVRMTLETGGDEGPHSAKVALTLHDEDSARARDTWPAGVGPVRADPLLSRELSTNGAGQGVVRFPAPRVPGRYWARLEASDSKGHRGVGWCALRVEAPLSVDLHVPLHLVAGDRAEATVVVRCAGPTLLSPHAALRVSWKDEGLELGPPRVSGARVLLEGDAGGDTVRLGVADEVQLTFSLAAASPGAAKITVSAQIEDDPAPPVSAEQALPVRVRGLSQERSWAGQVPAGGSTLLRLELPKDALPGAGQLEVSVDPTLGTAALAGLHTLGRAPGLRAALSYQVAHRALAHLIEARALKLRLPPAPPFEPLLARLLAARRQGAWGDSSRDLLAALRQLARDGVAVPPALLAGEDSPTDPRSLAGKAELLVELNRKGRDPQKQAALVGAIMAARVGAGWGDPADAGAAVLALAELAAGAEEVEGSRLVVRLETETLLDAFSGDGLAEWPGPTRRGGVRSRSRLNIESKAGPSALSYAVRLTAPVPGPRAEPTAKGGLRLTRTLTVGGHAAEPLRPIPAGTSLELRLTPARDDSAGEGPLRLEVPLPGGVVVLGLPPELERDGDTLLGEVDAAPLTLRLLCVTPGEYTWLPARIRSQSHPERVATSGETQLRIVR